MKDVRRVEAWRKISFSFFPSLTLIGKYVQNVVIFFSLSGSIVLLSIVYIYIYIHIEQRIFCMLPLHNFSPIFWGKNEEQEKKEEEVTTIPSGFLL
jgi:hypothetical protein